MILYKDDVNEVDKCSHNKLTMKKIIFLLVVLSAACRAQYNDIYIKLKDCLSSANAVVCLKEEALNAINETIYSDKAITLFEMVDIVKDPKYRLNTTEETLPAEASLRSTKLNELLFEKVDEFISSRTIQLNLNSVIEGRKKKGKTGLMMMLGGAAMAGMMAKMMMSKIAFMAGAAFIIAKIALLLSAIMIAKKMGGGGGGGGGETQHVVYTTAQSDYGHSHGGGGGGGYGYARSWQVDEAERQKMAYNAHIPEERRNLAK